jgi:hypothetical protein
MVRVVTAPAAAVVTAPVVRHSRTTRLTRFTRFGR